MRVAPIAFALIASAAFVVAVEAEAPVHFLAAAWLSSAVVVLMLAICRFTLFGRRTRLKWAGVAANGLVSEWRMRCDDWGMAMTAALVISGLVFLYLLD
jgi:hypothetical protein